MVPPMEERTKRLLVALLLTCALALPAAAADAAAPIAHVACTHAVIAGESKCIARGEYCKRSAAAQRDYRRHGLSCTKRDARGRYHLQ